MGEIRFSITLGKHEWDKIEEVIKDSSKESLAPKGKGFSQFISNGLNKYYKGKSYECPQKNIPTVQKTFALKVDDEIERQINCEATQLGVPPGHLIARKILVPIIDNKPK